MNNIKKLFTEKIVEPAADSRSSSTIIGEVTKCNENSNTCDIRFTTAKGKIEDRSGILVFSYNKSVIDWFPKENDKVLLEENNNVLYIKGPANLNNSRMRSEIELENDIYSDSFVSGVGGYIF